MIIDEQHINFTTIGDLKQAIKDMDDGYVVVESFTDTVDYRSIVEPHNYAHFTQLTARRHIQTSDKGRVRGKLVY